MQIPDLTFIQLLTVMLIGLLFFREEITPWIKQVLGVGNRKRPSTPATSEQLDALADYVNHQQTEILKRQTHILEEVKESVYRIERKHEEYDKFGIKMRHSTRK